MAIRWQHVTRVKRPSIWGHPVGISTPNDLLAHKKYKCVATFGHLRFGAYNDNNSIYFAAHKVHIERIKNTHTHIFSATQTHLHTEYATESNTSHLHLSWTLALWISDPYTVLPDLV